jgi:hypothetical protein
VPRPSAEEESMGGIDWTNIPLEAFWWVDEEREDGKRLRTIRHPHGDGVAQSIMMSISSDVESAYAGLLPSVEDPYGDPLLHPDEDVRRFGPAGEVPVIRDGRRGYERLDSITLADLPAVLDTLAAMDEEKKRLEAEEAARRDAERKRRRNARARERRKREKLGEWKLGE